MSRVVHGVWLFAVVACAGNAQEGTAAPQPRRYYDVEQYLPLVDGTVYTYETSSEETGEQGVLMLHVVRPRPERAELVVAGRPQLLELGPDGARYATGGYLLRQPLFVGAQYQGSFGTVRVTSTDQRLTTPAGSFEHCIETIEENRAKRARTVFCRDVGMVLLEVEGLGSETLGLERAVLRSHGPRVDLSLGRPIESGELPSNETQDDD
jgi:hypothetical protein